MRHNCKNYFINIAGGQVSCEKCGNETFFTNLGISASEVIDAGGYATPDKDGTIPSNDVEMIEFLYKSEIDHLKKKIKQLTKTLAG